MAELTIQWKTLSKIPTPEKPVLTSEDAPAPAADAAEPAKTALEKPLFIYVIDPAGSTGFDQVEKVILDDDRVKLGTRAFEAVKMTADDVKADPLLGEKAGKEVPRFIFVTADMKTTKVLEGAQLKLGETWSTMKATANKHYKQDLDTVVRDLKSVLIEFDKIAKERTVLEDKEKRAGDKGLTAADKKDIEAKRAELDARQKKAEELKSKVSELRMKA
jgi:hypothetical protein